MGESFDALQFAWYVRRHWRKTAICCVSAVALTLIGSLLLPKRYTAISTVVIDPPGGMDPRAASTISPVYLESLRTFELMASSDSLFTEALDHQHLRQKYPGKSIESLKRSILQVTKPATTRLVQISATTDNPKDSQAMAQYMAERTVALSRSLNLRGSADTVKEAQTVFENATVRLQNARKAVETYLAKEANGAAESQLNSTSELRLQAARDLNKAEEELAGLLSEQAAAGSATPSWIVSGIGAARARIETLNKQRQLLEPRVEAAGREMERMKQLRERLGAEMNSARVGYDTAKTKLDDVNSWVTAHGERLEVLDPGIVPQRPSFPNTGLNVLVALLMSLVASIGWQAAQFGYEHTSEVRREKVYSLK